MTKNAKEIQINEKPEEKEPQDTSNATGACGCGCLPPIERKQRG